MKDFNIERFMQGLKDIQHGVSGAGEVLGMTKTTYRNVASTIGSGKSFVNGLKEGIKIRRKMAWYSALRGAEEMLNEGQLDSFKKLVCEAPCRRDPAFLWGVCRRLGEVAAESMWDTNTRRVFRRGLSKRHSLGKPYKRQGVDRFDTFEVGLDCE